MPITKAAKKALRKNKRQRENNLNKSRLLKDELSALKKLITAKTKKGAAELLPKIYKALDKAVKTNLLKKNTASRMKSRLTKIVNKL
ncbi:MAG: 30S ribosomal protein S20 [Candidatus Azambacteria bacterium]|nr:30S ribosomal protein S20 [Candidatus Azambacteria bacterium]